MRKIQFDAETIEAIKEYVAAGHTMDQTQNRFNLKYDTLRRVMHENGIEAFYRGKQRYVRKVSEDDEALICTLYSCTDTSMADIVKATKLQYYIVKEVLDKHYSKEYQDKRKAKLYSASKSGENNPWHGKQGPRYKGDPVEDGNGYLMVMRPDWYTGRLGKYYVFQHTVVMCEYLGITELPRGMVVHHIDYNKKNNDISNLALLTAGAHSRLHAIEKKMCKGAETIRNGVGNSDSAQAPDN